MNHLKKEKLNDVKKVERAINKNLFRICTTITFIVMLMLVVGFFTRQTFPASQIGFFYIGVLFVYAVHKEMLRWLEEKELDRRGEYFLYSWIGLTTFLYITAFLTKGYFCNSTAGIHLECLQEITVITFEVAIIFLFTRLSKVIKLISLKK